MRRETPPFRAGRIRSAYRFRFYPTPEQEQLLARTFGCARFAYNDMLRLRSDAWLQRQERVGYHETSAALTALKKTSEHTWRNEVSRVPVPQALRHLNTAFSNFFAKREILPLVPTAAKTALLSRKS